jgi:hypothetical protein
MPGGELFPLSTSPPSCLSSAAVPLEGPRSEEFSCGRKFARELSAADCARLALRRRARPWPPNGARAVTARPPAAFLNTVGGSQHSGGLRLPQRAQCSDHFNDLRRVECRVEIILPRTDVMSLSSRKADLARCGFGLCLRHSRSNTRDWPLSFSRTTRIRREQTRRTRRLL